MKAIEKTRISGIVTPAERQRDADRHREDDADHRDDERHHETAPEPRVHHGKSAAIEPHQRDHDADGDKNRQADEQRARAGAQSVAKP